MVLWAAILGVLVAIRDVLLPFFIAVFLAYVIHPVVTHLSALQWRERRLPRWGSVLALYTAALLGLWLSALFVVPQISGEVGRLWRTTTGWLQHLDEAQLEATATRLDAMARRLGLPVRVVASRDSLLPDDQAPQSEFRRPPSNGAAPAGPTKATRVESDGSSDQVIDLRSELRALVGRSASLLQAQTGAIAAQIQAIVGGALGFVFSFFLVLMITAFLTSDTPRIKRFLFSLLPLEDQDAFDQLLDRIDGGLSGVVRGQLTICVVNGLLTLVGLLLLKVKFAFLLAILAAVFSLVPIFGSILSTLPIVLVAVSTSGLGTAVLALAWIVGIHALEANLLNPKIMGDAAKIHPAVVVLVLVAGEHYYGIPGALFAVPVTSIAVTVFRSLHSRLQHLDRESQLPRRAQRNSNSTIPPPPRDERLS
ncbi:MAG: AI-2E family transporter [Myxococcota bacterium]